MDPHGPYVLPGNDNWDEWQLIEFRLDCTFVSGERLSVIDNYSRKNINAKIYRLFNFQFMHPSGDLIFRLCTHGEEIPSEDPPHLHPGRDDIRWHDGDGALKGFELREIGFPEAFKLVHDYLEKKGLPWE